MPLTKINLFKIEPYIQLLHVKKNTERKINKYKN